MRILIDADGCPVIKNTIEVAKKRNIEVITLCDTSHILSYPDTKSIVVSKGADSVDFKLVNLIQSGDIVITQDYGLAAMCLSKRATVLNQDGMIYDDDNILPLLNQRAFAKKLRRSGGRLKGAPKRTSHQDEAFTEQLIKLVNK